MTYLCQWLFLIPALHGHTHAEHPPPPPLPTRARAGNDRRCPRSLNAMDSCRSRDLVRRAAVRSWSASSDRLGSARLDALSSGSASSCFCGAAGPTARRPGPQVIDKQIMETNKACLLSLQTLVFRVVESTTGVGQPASHHTHTHTRPCSRRPPSLKPHVNKQVKLRWASAHWVMSVSLIAADKRIIKAFFFSDRNPPGLRERRMVLAHYGSEGAVKGN